MKYLLIIFTTLMGAYAHAQQALTLDELLTRVRSSSYQSKINLQEQKISQADLQSSNSAFLPQINASYTGYSTNDALSVFGFKMQERLVEATDFNPALLNDPNQRFNFNTKFSIKQPLLNMEVFPMREALQESIKASKLKGQRIEDAIVYEAKKYYADLTYLYEAKQTVLSAISTVNENLKVAKNNLDQGFMKKSDYLLVEVEKKKAESQLQMIESNILNISNMLHYLMGEQSTTAIKPSYKILYTPGFQSTASIDQRNDVQAMECGVRGKEKMIHSEKFKSLPKINSFGEYNLYDRDAVGFNSSSYIAGVQLSWNIFQGNTSRAAINKQKIELNKLKDEIKEVKAKAQLEADNALNELKTLESKIEVAKIKIEQIKEEETYQTNRMNQGMAKKTDILMLTSSKYEKELDLLDLINQHNKLQYKIEFLTK